MLGVVIQLLVVANPFLLPKQRIRQHFFSSIQHLLYLNYQTIESISEHRFKWGDESRKCLQGRYKEGAVKAQRSCTEVPTPLDSGGPHCVWTRSASFLLERLTDQ